MVKKSSTKKKGGACAGGCWAAGKRRTYRGGMYGVGEPITPGALTYGAAYTGPVDGAGNAVPDPTDPAGGYTGIGGRKGRKTRKGRASRASRASRKGRKGRKGTRKMRGGANQISMGTTGYGYAGTGSGGLIDPVQYTTQGNAF